MNFAQNQQHSRDVVSKDGITVNSKKTKAKQKWTTPTSPTEIHSFIGLDNYYRHFVQDLSRIEAPLTKLRKKKVKFK